MFLLTLLLKQAKLRTASGLERPSEDLAMSDAAGGAGDAEYDEREIGSGAAEGQPASGDGVPTPSPPTTPVG
jgi:hypothetical protein